MAGQLGPLRVSKRRFTSEQYLIFKDKKKFVLPIVISNWREFIDSDNQAMLENKRLRMDTEKVKETIKANFGNIQIMEFENKSKDDLLKELRDMAASLSKERFPDVLMCFIIGRGKNDYIYEFPLEKNRLRPAKPIQIKDILKIFNGEQCPALVLRPKLFFVQIEWKYRDSPGGEFKNEGANKNAMLKTVPIESDFFVYSSYKLTDPRTDKISRFTEVLCEELQAKGDLLDLTTRVNNKIFDYTKDTVHIPLCICQLTKKMVFN